MRLCMVGYTYRQYPMAHGMERAAAFGYEGIELRSYNDVDMSTPEGVAATLPRARTLAEAHGLAIESAYYDPLPISRDDGERRAEEERFTQVITLLGEAGIPILHTHMGFARQPGGNQIVSAGARKADYEAVASSLARILPAAERHNVRIAVETHMNRIHDTAASLRRILDDTPSPYLVATLDFANMHIVHPHEDLLSVIHEFGADIGYIHIKNVKLTPTGYDWNIALRWGELNYHLILKTLTEVGYEGPLAVEYCGTGDPDVFAEDDARYIRQLMARL